MSLCKFFGKYILYLFNLLSLISAVGILTFSIILYQKLDKLSTFISTELNITTLVLFIIGLGLFMVALIGLCGVLRDSECLLTLFSILLTTILIGELVLAGFIYHNRGAIENYALTEMNNSLPLYNTTNNEVVTDTWNWAQGDLKCCGINNPKDWSEFLINKLPDTCCNIKIKNATCTDSYSYKDGCFNKVKSFLENNTQLIIDIVIGFALVQLLAILLASCRKCYIREEYETV